jgi:hypothetical protein
MQPIYGNNSWHKQNSDKLYNYYSYFGFITLKKLQVLSFLKTREIGVKNAQPENDFFECVVKKSKTTVIQFFRLGKKEYIDKKLS